MPRERNPRVVFLQELTEILKLLGGVAASWKWHSRRTVYVPQDEREPGGPWNRPRRPDEYPEALAANWLAMAKWCDWAAGKLSKLAIRARMEAAKGDRVMDKEEAA